jgi:hypothetical protein
MESDQWTSGVLLGHILLLEECVSAENNGWTASIIEK